MEEKVRNLDYNRNQKRRQVLSKTSSVLMILITFLFLDVVAFLPDKLSYFVNAFIMNVLNKHDCEILTSINVN